MLGARRAAADALTAAPEIGTRPDDWLGPHAWHALPAERVVAALATDVERGLAPADVAHRRARVGDNRVTSARGVRAWRVALRQFESLVVLLLLAAAVVAATLGERVEAGAILAALVLNAAVGFATEWKAHVSLAKLRDLVAPRALVRRDGTTSTLPAADLVPGDVVLLDAGAQVPADVRLIESAGLRSTEAALTGESEPVEKDATAHISPDAPVADRTTMAFLGTAIVSGHAVGVVIATGPRSELGRIGQLVENVGERATPLERQVEQLGRRLIVLTLVVCALVGVAGVLHGERLALMIETALTLAVSAVPEGLPAILTVALAAGLWRLARAGALVRRLPAVEALGATTVICADKTGTITENRMTVTRIVVGDRTISVTGGPGAATGGFVEDHATIDPRGDAHLARALSIGALVNNATAELVDGALRAQGDPTETALLIAAMKAGLDPVDLGRRWPRQREIPFATDTRVMATLHDCAGGPTWLVKGGPGVVLERSAFVQHGDAVRRMTDEDREALLQRNRRLADEGLRVLALAWRPAERSHTPLDDLTFVGLVGITDPIRPGVVDAIARCAGAGIRTIVVTGDQRSTAEAVGRQLGLAPEAVRSRVSPEDKLALVASLQSAGDVVAMTGDGVNDAPALARADVGVAMGARGTDVAREAADIVLTDDNFATIVRAVEEGRVIHDNLAKVIRFLFSCNLSEILTVFVAIVAGLPSPLLPLQILWINLVTDIVPGFALIGDPAERRLMRRPPRARRDSLVTARAGARIALESVLLAAGVLGAYVFTIVTLGAGARASTVAFVALVLVHPLQAMNCRSTREPSWRLAWNPLLWGALAMLAAVQWCATAWPPLASLLGTVPLSGRDWLVCAVAIVWPVALLEWTKTLIPRSGGTGHETSRHTAPGVST